ncbi:hypothetical protein [Nostoc sp. CENA543]|uniref:hypothetical protein n=1 Tax=Nostoc sp. CENA543 TaxID=1869241 RepID=UPI001CEF5E1B|nr:hypothetical protein [Nostoc sp. CENA543]
MPTSTNGNGYKIPVHIAQFYVFGWMEAAKLRINIHEVACSLQQMSENLFFP